MEWRHTGSPAKKKFKTALSTKKPMATVFFERKGVLLIDIMPRGNQRRSVLWNFEKIASCNSEQTAWHVVEGSHSFARHVTTMPPLTLPKKRSLSWCHLDEIFSPTPRTAQTLRLATFIFSVNWRNF